MSRKECYFCRKKLSEIDYRDTALLSRYLGFWAKIKPAHDTGVCAKHQRRLEEAIKRARYLGLMPYTTR